MPDPTPPLIQPRLWPRRFVTCELIWHYDAQGHDIDVGWQIRETDSDAVIATEAGHRATLRNAVGALDSRSMMLHTTALGLLEPF